MRNFNQKVAVILVFALVLFLSMSVVIADSGKTNASQAVGLTNLSKNMTDLSKNVTIAINGNAKIIGPAVCQDLRRCIENCTKIQNCTIFTECIQSCATLIGESNQSITGGVNQTTAPPKKA